MNEDAVDLPALHSRQGHNAQLQQEARRSSLARVMLAANTMAIVFAAVLAGCTPSAAQTTKQPTLSSDAIQRENAQRGTASWIITPDHRATTEIQAYASALSVQASDTLTFYVSVQVDGTAYIANIYRLGWYGGEGGRLLLSEYKRGQAQGYYDQVDGTLVGCASCTLDPTTDMVEANWQPSFAITIPTNWVTGVYLATLTDANGKQTYVTFDVRGDPTSAYVVVTPDTTAEAYNTWGGYSLYIGPDGTGTTRANTVSFNRPLVSLGGFPWQIAAGDTYDQGLPTYIDAVRWFEHAGYDVSYMSSVDLDQHPGLLRSHAAYISVGHDEYWSKAMRDGVEQARDAGISLIFMGANTAYWQIRFQADSAGIPDRHIVCYKDSANDPLNGVDNSQVTVQWRDPPLNRPENALIGIMYAGNVRSGLGFSWYLADQANSPLLAGTGLKPGQAYGCDLVGYEWDRVVDNGDTPAGLQVIGDSPTVADQGGYSSTTSYTAPSGAFVFASGSIYWGHALDSYRIGAVGGCTQPDTVVPGIQKLMANVMKAAVHG